MHKIAIRCKASTVHGMGHLVRQIRIGSALRDAGASVTYFIDDFRPAADSLSKTGFAFHVVQPEEVFLRRLSDKVDLTVIDQKDNAADYVRDLRPFTRALADFEDLGAGRNLVDLLIDANLDEAEWGKIGPGVKTLFGLPYAVLHPDFEKCNRLPRVFPGEIRSVLTTLGGTDPKNLTALLAETILKQNPDLSLTAVTGAGFGDWQSLERLRSGWNHVRTLHDIANMAEVLASHDAVFCAGGVTLHEAMAAGTPAFVLNQVPHQEKKAKYFEKFGAAVNLGLAEDWNPDKIFEALATKGERLESMSRAGKSLVDGGGLRRVVEEFRKLLGRS